MKHYHIANLLTIQVWIIHGFLVPPLYLNLHPCLPFLLYLCGTKFIVFIHHQYMHETCSISHEMEKRKKAQQCPHSREVIFSLVVCVCLCAILCKSNNSVFYVDNGMMSILKAPLLLWSYELKTFKSGCIWNQMDSNVSNEIPFNCPWLRSPVWHIHMKSSCAIICAPTTFTIYSTIFFCSYLGIVLPVTIKNITVAYCRNPFAAHIFQLNPVQRHLTIINRKWVALLERKSRAQ